ncbi:hypothetical protein Lepto7376_4598 [[Leptolyngbya] sp. PCC 7376]|uniref:VOC family protein n=1 Tax=[Leptolyngbya] sp. PCC 7376 TaxID=111781 RepID=UPI00029EF7BD|nr:VOC family protein [[Leptolyngbya] sp. PCC 7376]AFY40688.1 hypothetical protein Lepto7376_4598 [[Leptolyngbya] sp. PCC 7376]
MLELDHIFILTQTDAPEADAVMDLGFLEGSRNTHPGQGTANRRLFFNNLMLEFLWVRDAAETQTANIAPIEFLARSNYRQSGYSPFGLGLRYAPKIDAQNVDLPFETWEFRPPYLPPHLKFDIALTYPHEPLIFVMPFHSTRPDAAPSEKRQPLEHPNNLREISEVSIVLPQDKALSPALQMLQELNFVGFEQGQEPCLTLTFDNLALHKITGFQPQLPLIFRY